VRVTFLVTSEAPDEPDLPTVRRLAAGLASRGHAVSVVPALAPEQAEDRTAQPSVLVSPAWSTSFTARTDDDLRRRLSTLDTDVIVAAGIGPLAFAARLTGSHVPLVLLASGLPVTGQESGTTGTAYDAEALALLGRVSHVVTPSRATAAAWRDLVAGSGPVVEVVPPSLDGPGVGAFRPQATLDSRLVMTVDHGAQRLPLRRLIAAFGLVAEEMPGWRLRIVGAGPGRIDLQRIIRKSGLYDRVELTEPVERTADAWALASIAVHTAHGDSLLLDVQEAMAAGVPAVAYDTPAGAADLIEHERTGLLVAPASPAGMSSALLRLAADPELREHLGSAASQVQRGRPSGDAAQAWEELLEASASSPGRRRSAPPSPAAAPAHGPGAPVLSPAQARRLTLESAVLAAERTQSRWFVIPPAKDLPPVVVLPMQAQSAFLRELADRDPELSLVRPADAEWPESRGRLPDQVDRFRNARVRLLRLEPWPGDPDRPGLASQGCSVEIEFWDETPQGGLRSHRPNRYITGIAGEAPFVPVTIDDVACRTLELMTRPTVHDRRFPIDVVYTWVDGSDPGWAESRRQTVAALTGTEATRESSGLARFTDRDELRYSLRSVHLFAPWVRQIHLVTAGQRPDWLADHPKIRLVDHRDILPESALPTFNSHAIETSLHRVPGLAEQWIYLNDDVFLGRPLTPAHFFSASGQPHLFPEEAGVGDPALSLTAEPWRTAAWNNRALLEQAFGVINLTAMRHTPHPQRRSLLEEIESRFSAAFDRTRHAAFRSGTDISTLSSLAQHYGLATGQAVVGDLEDAYVNISAAQVVGRLNRLLRREQDTFCLGDHHDHALQPHRLEEVLTEFFAAYFPIAAPWERGSKEREAGA